MTPIAPVDVLVFGPHPDDLEIGLGGTIALHVAAGQRVGLCDLTAGELSSNGTPAQRRAEALEAAAVLGADWRECLGWPDGAIAQTPDALRSAVDLIRRARPRAIAVPYWDDRHPDHVASSQALRQAVFTSGLRRYESADEAMASRLAVLLLHQRRRHAVLRRRRVGPLPAQTRGAGLLPQSVRAR